MAINEQSWDECIGLHFSPLPNCPVDKMNRLDSNGAQNEWKSCFSYFLRLADLMETRHTFISARIFADNGHNCQVAEYKDIGPGGRGTCP